MHAREATQRARARESRRVWWVLLGFVLLLGLGTRRFASAFPPVWAAYAPDALWALLVFVLLALVAPRWRWLKVALGALGFSYVIELSQLCQAPWLNAIRRTRLGALVLGQGFLWSDLVCYTVGIGCGVLLMVWLERRFARSASAP